MHNAADAGDFHEVVRAEFSENAAFGHSRYYAARAREQ